MRKICVLLLLTAILLMGSAYADEYSFGSIFMSLSVSNDYELVVTPESLEANSDAVQARGYTVEGLRQQFQDEGILLMAFDDDKDRVFVVTAVQDEQSQSLYDINEQSSNVRATYRTNHSNGTYCGALGYKFETCEWKNFGNDQGRFLMLKYVLRKDGAVAHKGLWRRTIRNGYTITLDMRAMGRSVTSGDITALNKIQDTVSFSAVTGAPEAPLTMAFTAPPPSVSNTDTFTIKGSTRAGASVRAAFYSFRQSDKATIVTTTADSKGAFALEITLPSQDLYNGIVTSTINEGLENEETVDQTFSVEYDEGLLPISFTSDFPAEFTGDSFKYTGTTLTGVTIQVNVNGENTTKKTGNNRTFSFTVDTSKEGTYKIQVTFTKKDYDTRIIDYVVERSMNEEERRAYIHGQSISPEYATLSSKTDNYIGKIVRYNGYITGVEEVGGEWVISFATKKSGEKYANIVMVTSDAAVSYPVGTQLLLYGTVDGQHFTYVDEKTNLITPRVKLLYFDELSK